MDLRNVFSWKNDIICITTVVRLGGIGVASTPSNTHASSLWSGSDQVMGSMRNGIAIDL